MLRDDVQTIWKAGVAAVDSERLVRSVVRRTGDTLQICGHDIPVAASGRMAVVGAGKAGAGMAAAIEDTVGVKLLRNKLFGWVNVPADCVRSLQKIHLHAARPAGWNEPTAEGVEGSVRILDIVGALDQNDIGLVLLSGGGSALLPAPVSGVSLEDKQAVTRLLMQSGATINELNCVRKQLSRIKGGRLARATRAGLVITLIISDVVGDVLDVIASGPTVPDTSTAAEALGILERYANCRADIPEAVWTHLTTSAQKPPVAEPFPETVSNHIVGNNAMALNAAAEQAKKLGYTVHNLGSDQRGEARSVGRALAELCLAVRDQANPVAPPACLLSGGEPVVHLVKTDRPRKGGRNQELVLAAVDRLWNDGMERIAILSGGTDGEDGPTDAAGAFADQQLLNDARAHQLLPASFLDMNNSYPFFEQTGGSLKTGPTHTNVMDLRVAVVCH